MRHFQNYPIHHIISYISASLLSITNYSRNCSGFLFLLGGELVENLLQTGLRDRVVHDAQYLLVAFDQPEERGEGAHSGAIFFENRYLHTYFRDLALPNLERAEVSLKKPEKIVHFLFQQQPRGQRRQRNGAILAEHHISVALQSLFPTSHLQ